MTLSHEPPAPPPRPSALRVAVMGDLHVGENDRQPYRQLFSEVAGEADALVLCGDLTNHGKSHEVEILAEDLMACAVPVLGVLGNHDYECGQHQEVCRILGQAGMRVLDGDALELHGVGFAGCKGFVGGYGRYMLSAFGEPEIKSFVQASVEENLKLETSLRMLRTDRTMVVLHYSPIPETLAGEPPEIFPFLGCSRMAETVDRYDNVGLVVHGHAHRGAYAGRTPRGVPVFNCALPVLMRQSGRPYAVFEV